MTPGARSSRLGEVADGCLRVRLAAPPAEGRANAELIRYVAEVLHVPRAAVSLTAGHKSRRKLLHLSGVKLDDARRRLSL